MQVKTIEIHGENEFATTEKTRVACRGVVIKDALMLISHEVNTDQFFIPGGGLETGETLEECCVREVQEETGYVVRANRHFLTIDEFYDDCKYVSHYFICEMIGKKEQHLTEAERENGLVPEWISPQEMLALYAKHDDFAATNEEKYGSYLREYTALREYFAFEKKE